MRNDLAIILTARYGSERLPGKALADVNGRPLIYWIMRRLSAIGKVILATTENPEDDALAGLAKASDIPVYRGATDDVVGRVNNALQKYHPNARFVLRGLGDCPFMAHELIERACEVMHRYKSDAFVWALAPSCMPVYGAREFPYSRQGWESIFINASEREHIDSYFHTNRDRFKISYHEPPKNVYFRTYRLEVDWAEDLELIRQIAKEVSMFSATEKIVEWLDAHQNVARINRERVERTGPSTYDYRVYREWARRMVGQPIVGWNNQVWQPPSANAIPVFCKSGQCLIGYGDNGMLHMRNVITGKANVKCDCGSNLIWQEKL